MYKDKNFYLNLFQVSEAQLERLAADGLGGGGSYCDLFFENTSYNNLFLRDGIVSSGGFHIDYGVGIRVLKGDKTGYAYSESTDPRSMAEAAAAASKIAEGGLATPARIQATTCPGPEDRYPSGHDWRSCDAGQIVPWLERLEGKIGARDPRIVKIIVSFSGQVSDILMFNSLGELTYDTRPMGVLSASAVFSQNGRIENKNTSRAFRAGTEMLTDAILDEMADSIVDGIDDRFAAKRPKGGQMPVVMARELREYCCTRPWGMRSRRTSTGKDSPSSRKGWGRRSVTGASPSWTTARCRPTEARSISTMRESGDRRRTWSGTAY